MKVLISMLPITAVLVKKTEQNQQDR